MAAHALDCRASRDTAGSDLLEQAAGGWPLSDRAVLWAKSTVWSRAFNIPYLGQPLDPAALHTNLTELSCHNSTCPVYALL